MPAMNSEQPISPRRRLQALLAIPDSQRSEAEWDELVELEISLAPGNRADGAPRQDMPRQTQQPRQNNNPGRNPAPAQPGGGTKPPRTHTGPRGKRPPRKPRDTPPKGNPDQT
jgi:hypothetical protein